MPPIYTPFDSPLRYPGGKGKVAQFVRILLRKNGLSGGTYVEPYAGGAAVALALLNGEFVTQIHINDVDPAVYAFWRAAVDHGDELAARIRGTKPTLKEWQRQRERYEQSKRDRQSVDVFDLGFAAFFLNRTNRSGIITGGPIGGHAQVSQWGIDARYNAEDLANRVLNVGANAGRIRVSNLDAAELLTRVVPTLGAKTLVYLDPPYYEKGASKLYANFYRAEEHAEISRLVANLPRPWIVSYDDAPAIHRLYAGYRRIRYNLSYSANERRRGGEAMFFSNALVVPDVVTPERITPKRARALEQDARPRMLSERSRRVPRARGADVDER